VIVNNLAISKRRPDTGHLKSLNIKQNTTNDVENRVPGSGRAQKCDGHQPVNDITTIALLMI
jgi:hypothetical protein